MLPQAGNCSIPLCTVPRLRSSSRPLLAVQLVERGSPSLLCSQKP